MKFQQHERLWPFAARTLPDLALPRGGSCVPPIRASDEARPGAFGDHDCQEKQARRATKSTPFKSEVLTAEKLNCTIPDHCLGAPYERRRVIFTEKLFCTALTDRRSGIFTDEWLALQRTVGRV
jgi:hypothetical protein